MMINLDFIYPVGSIYLSAKPTNPGTLFGGTWIQIKGRYLYAVNATSGNKGKDSLSTYTGVGTQSHAITINEMPSHKHDQVNLANNYLTAWNTKTGNVSGIDLTNLAFSNGTAFGTGIQNSFDTQNTGGSQGHTHNIAYVDVYMWQRTA